MKNTKGSLFDLVHEILTTISKHLQLSQCTKHNNYLYLSTLYLTKRKKVWVKDFIFSCLFQIVETFFGL